MSVNKINAKELFGDKFPTVFIDKVEIMSLDDAKSGYRLLGLEGHDPLVFFMEHLGENLNQVKYVLDGDGLAGDIAGPVHQGLFSLPSLGEDVAAMSETDLRGLFDSYSQSVRNSFHVARVQSSIYFTFRPDLTHQEIHSYLRQVMGKIQVFVVYNTWYPFTAQVADGTLSLYDLFKAQDDSRRIPESEASKSYMKILSDQFAGSYVESLKKVITEFGTSRGFTYDSAVVDTSAQNQAQLCSLAPAIMAPQIQSNDLDYILDFNVQYSGISAELRADGLEPYISVDNAWVGQLPMGFWVDNKTDSKGNMIIRVPMLNTFAVPNYISEQSLMTSVMAFTSMTSDTVQIDAGQDADSVLKDGDWKAMAISPYGTDTAFAPAYHGARSTGTDYAGDASEDGSSLLSDSGGMFGESFITGQTQGAMGHGNIDATALRSLFNSGCGDVSYEYVTSMGKLNTNAQQVYVYASTDETCDSKAIQALNGNYYETTEAVSQEKLSLALQTLIDKYYEFRGDDDLNRNLSNLERILLSHGTKVNFIPRLGTYRGVYPDKSSNSISGKFYNKFRGILSKMNKAVQQQKRLKKVLTLNRKIIDTRASGVGEFSPYIKPLKNPAYPMSGIHDSDSCFVQPMGLNAPGASGNVSLGEGSRLMDPVGVEELDYSELYAVSDFTSKYQFIPFNWGTMSRKTKMVHPAFGATSDFLEFLVEEEFGGTGYMANPDGIADQWFGRETDFWGNKDNEQTSNTIVENTGFWFFDYEKALSSQSMISSILDVTRIGRYLGYKVPYQYYPMKEVHMWRREAVFNTGAETLQDAYGTADGSNMSYKLMHFYSTFAPEFSAQEWPVPGTTFMQTQGTTEGLIEEGESLNPEIPYLTPMIWTVDTDINTKQASISLTLDSDDGVWSKIHTLTDDDYIDPSKDSGFIQLLTDLGTEYDYMVGHGNVEKAEWMELKLVSFDVANADPTQRLQGLNTGRVEGGYRLACFQYRDFMDDDVAFHNTLGMTVDTIPEDILPSGIDARADLATSRYYQQVICDDFTSAVYRDIYDKVLATYEALAIYHETAEQECNHDIFTSTFTSMFKQSMLAQYPDPELHPWSRAAYVYHAMYQIIAGNINETNTDGAYSVEQSNSAKELLIEKAVKLNHKINPYTGDINSLAMFRYRFLVLLNRLYPQAEISSAADTPFRKRMSRLGINDTSALDSDIFNWAMSRFSYDYAYRAASDSYEYVGSTSTPADVTSFWSYIRDPFDATLRATAGVSAGETGGGTERIFSGIEPIRDPIYGNLLLSHLTRNQWVSPVEIPFGASQLTDNQIRIQIKLENDGDATTDAMTEYTAFGVYSSSSEYYEGDGAQKGHLVPTIAIAALVDLAKLEHIYSDLEGLGGGRDNFFGTVGRPGNLVYWLNGIQPGQLAGVSSAEMIGDERAIPDVANKRLQFASALCMKESGEWPGQYQGQWGPNHETFAEILSLRTWYLEYGTNTVASDRLIPTDIEEGIKHGLGQAALENSGLVLDINSPGFKAKWAEYTRPAIMIVVAGAHFQSVGGGAEAIETNNPFHGSVILGGEALDIMTGWTNFSDDDALDLIDVTKTLLPRTATGALADYAWSADEVTCLVGTQDLLSNEDPPGYPGRNAGIAPGKRNVFQLTYYRGLTTAGPEYGTSVNLGTAVTGLSEDMVGEEGAWQSRMSISSAKWEPTQNERHGGGTGS